MNTSIQLKLEQAQAAFTASNWSLLVQCLQQLIPVGKREQSGINTTPEATQLLNFAIAVLFAGDFQQRWDVAKLIPRLGTIAIAPLVEILEEDDDDELCWFAARTLGEFDHPQAIAALVELIKTTDNEELQAIAATALGQIGSSAVTVLTELLVDENTRLIAVRSLAYIRRSETIAPLLSVVSDPQVNVRATAIEALSSFHDSRIAPVLLHALNDIAAFVRREAVLGLGFRADLCTELDLVAHILPRLYDFNLDVCHAAAIALGRLGTEPAVIGLDQVLQSPHTPESLQIEIVRALGRIESNLALDKLSSFLEQSPSVAVCQEIITVLGQVEQPNNQVKAANILINMLRLQHPATEIGRIRGVIALSLGYLGQLPAIEPLINLLADSERVVKLHAIAALKKLAPEIAHQQLQQIATSDVAPELKQGVAIALAEWSN
ncbi:HEAT repeat domain-containing protein [Gloeocapsopsis dulcis]|uniref:HEAT repeat domain-containing protein n=1 Tax=Gloeocapsopsis dulcis TaxID=2859516 RepID=UPI001913D2F7|nr:HEAT repeat domain-containing protein [Gloeocapsopsis dulcis]WNN88046.1 HEAT repeat domain-containing protein [Gloeocapsopsis dulcis]